MCKTSSWRDVGGDFKPELRATARARRMRRLRWLLMVLAMNAAGLAAAHIAPGVVVRSWRWAEKTAWRERDRRSEALSSPATSSSVGDGSEPVTAETHRRRRRKGELNPAVTAAIKTIEVVLVLVGIVAAVIGFVQIGSASQSLWHGGI